MRSFRKIPILTNVFTACEALVDIYPYTRTPVGTKTSENPSFHSVFSLQQYKTRLMPNCPERAKLRRLDDDPETINFLLEISGTNPVNTSGRST